VPVHPFGNNVVAHEIGRCTSWLARRAPDAVLPETKNHSVEEVVQIFEREAEGGQGASEPLARAARGAAR
jgi:hypothetical protein